MPNKKENKIISGVLSVNARGTGYLKVTDKKGEDIEIQNNNLNTALNGDTVSIIILSSRKNERVSGKVLSIEKRAKRTFDIIVSKENVINKKAEVGKKVLVKIISWSKEQTNPQGEILQILGQAGEHNTEMESILYEKGFEINFPEIVEAEAERLEKMEKPIPQTEIAKRRDFRDTLTFTIDPKDAKDFDDAISLKSLPNGNFEIGVHIADVSHYVREKTALDQEAVKREFSVYLVDRTIPMLPEVLSNDICSLNPGEEKLTFSAVFEMTSNGKIISRWFGKTIIKSDKRFTYELAQESLNNKDGEYHQELKILDDIAKKLRKEKTPTI